MKKVLMFYSLHLECLNGRMKNQELTTGSIILIPVELSKKSPRQNTMLNILEMKFINPAIQYKLNSDYNITLEDFEVDENFKLLNILKNLKALLKTEMTGKF